MSKIGLPSAKGSATSGFIQKNLSAKLSTKHFEPIERKRVADPKLIQHNIKRKAMLAKIRGNNPPNTIVINKEENDELEKEKQMSKLADALGIDRTKHIEGQAFENIRKLEPTHIVEYSSSSEESSSSSESEEESSSDDETAVPDFQLNDKFATSSMELVRTLPTAKSPAKDLVPDSKPTPSIVQFNSKQDVLSSLRKKVEESNKRKPSERIKALLLKKKLDQQH